MSLVFNLRDREGWAFGFGAVTIVAAVLTLWFALFPNVMPSSTDPAFSLTIENASSTDYTLTIMTWAAVIFLPLVLALPGLDVLDLPQARLALADREGGGGRALIGTPARRPCTSTSNADHGRQAAMNDDRATATPHADGPARRPAAAALRERVARVLRRDRGDQRSPRPPSSSRSRGCSRARSSGAIDGMPAADLAATLVALAAVVAARAVLLWAREAVAARAAARVQTQLRTGLDRRDRRARPGLAREPQLGRSSPSRRAAGSRRSRRTSAATCRSSCRRSSRRRSSSR